MSYATSSPQGRSSAYPNASPPSDRQRSPPHHLFRDTISERSALLQQQAAQQRQELMESVWRQVPHATNPVSSAGATPPRQSLFAAYRGDKRSYSAPYASPIRSAGAGSGASAPSHVSPAPSSLMQQPFASAAQTHSPVHSPAPRTPPRVLSTAVTGHADLRHPTVSAEQKWQTASATAAAAAATEAKEAYSTQRQVPHHRYHHHQSEQSSAHASAPQNSRARYSDCLVQRQPTDSAAAAAAAFSPSTSACWICLTRCLDGPVSTWRGAPALFFTSSAYHSHHQHQPVSTLSLCATCATALGSDVHATSQEVLQRCRHTSATRYRTSAYVNAVREYKLLLELMAEKVVRACERMRRVHAVSVDGQPASVYADPALYQSVELQDAPLSAFRLSLQEKVLAQLVEALEELLQRDSRAAQLAAMATSPMSGGGGSVAAQVPVSEIMAPRERHSLMEEVAHVERQLVRVRTAATERPSPTSPPPSSALSPPQQKERQSRTVRGADAFVVVSPRPSHSPAERAGEALTWLADPRRDQRHRSQRSPSSSTGSSGGGHSPPQLTSPQHLHGRSSSSSGGGGGGGGRVAAGSHQPPRSQREGVGRSAARPAAGPAPFPLSPAPHRERCRSPSHPRLTEEEEEEEEGRRDRKERGNTSAAPRAVREKTKTTVMTTSAGLPAESRSSQTPPLSGRGAMAAMVDSAMWAAHHRHTPAPHSPLIDPSGDERRQREGRRRDTHGDRDGDAADSDSAVYDDGHNTGHDGATADNILINYFAGRTDATPQIRMIGLSSGRGNRARDGARPADDQLWEGTDEAAAHHLRLRNERERRQAAEDALLQAHARIAALEQTTNDMAEELLSHRLAVTLRYHLAGMEQLLGRWTRLGQNYCLQKSLLFAEEAAAVVRAVQREAYGVAPLLRHREGQQRSPTAAEDGAHRAAGEGQVGAAVLARGDNTHSAPYSDMGEGEEEGEVWVTREESEGAAGPSKVKDGGSSSRSGGAAYAFPSELRLRPLSFHL